jgi:Glycosyltransferases involved in cell wall biogenesis
MFPGTGSFRSATGKTARRFLCIFIPMPQVSVIIPTFNRGQLLERAVNSVLKQTCRDFELIVVDDASQDNTGESNFLKDAPDKLSYFCFPSHRGVSAARNFGVKKSRGEWLAFLDSDDEWLPGKLEKQLAWHAAHFGYRISQTQEIWVRKGVRVNPPKTHKKIHEFQFRENLERCMITPSSVMIEKKLFLETGGFNEDFPGCEDYDLWLRITSAYPVGLVDELLLTRYGGHADQLSSTIPVLDRFRIQSMENILQSGKLSDEQRRLVNSELVKKALIVAEGYKKRGNEKEHERYQHIARRSSGTI